MLVSAMFTPHPPLIIPKIGGDDVDKVKNTVQAMEKLGQSLAEADPELIIVISPHGLIHQSEMLIGGSLKMTGSFESFGHPEINFSFSGDPDLADKIKKTSDSENIPVELINHDEGTYYLDHGVMVPLYYLVKELGLGLNILPISYSMLSRAEHYAFGQIIGQIIDESPERIAVIASGDLSHRLFSGDIGKKFDREIVENIKNFNPGRIIDIDEGLQTLAGECGYRSLLILLGALDGRKVKSEVLSYEGPFGVGYLAAEFKIL